MTASGYATLAYLAAISLVFMGLQVYGHYSKLRGIADGTTKKAGLALKVRARLRR